MTRLEEIENRLAAIKTEIETEGADLEALEKEIKSLKDERSAIKDKIEKRKALIDSVAGLQSPTVIENFKPEEKKMELDKDTVSSSKEYRSAFLKRLQGKELNEIEQRALTIAANSVGAAVPTQTQDEILKKLKEYAPMLNEITLLQVKGGVKYVMEGTVNEASLHTEGEEITASADTLVSVILGSYEITKLITISKSVATMSINAFETWLSDMLAESIANKINAYLISGTGTNQPTGIEKVQTWGAANSVSVTLAGSLTAANVQTLCGLLNGGYDNGAKFVMSKKTLFTDFLPLQDNAKHALVTNEGKQYYVYGYPVIFDDRITFHEAFLGNYKKAIVGNLEEDITVASDFDIKTNSYDYLGCAIFDSKVAIGEAVVKLVKATS